MASLLMPSIRCVVRPQKALQHTLRFGKHLCFTKRKTRGRLVFGCDPYADMEALSVIYDLDKEAAILESRRDDGEASLQVDRSAAGNATSVRMEIADSVSAQAKPAGTEQWRLSNVASILLSIAADQAEGKTGRSTGKVESETIRRTHKRKRGDGAKRGRKRARKDASKAIAIGVPQTKQEGAQG